jgi:hypothetical protein
MAAAPKNNKANNKAIAKKKREGILNRNITKKRPVGEERFSR